MSIAQQVVDQFRASRVTVSIQALAKRYDGKRNPDQVGDPISYSFPDGSILYTQGRGSRHKLWTGDPV